MDIYKQQNRSLFPLIRLSQGQLNLLETCPVQFQRIYFEQLNTPSSPSQQEKQTWGSQFHLLMQQRELGLPIDELLSDDDQLNHSLSALLQVAPELQQNNPDTWRSAEHCRTLEFQGYLFTVIYDLIIANSTQAHILDWKTYLQPEKPAKLANNWQTRLYLYVLAETSNYLPEQISMTYWFVKLPTQPQKIIFNYDRHQHEQTRQDLIRLLTQLDEWIKNYLEKNISFPHREDCLEKCPYAEILLDTQDESKNDNNRVFSIDEIAEINPFL
ncbi:PD-(D/E)XK nuclease family protein [Aphanothece hegewaldii CCALA 016]|uniref:PD-(D/E)XK nuclease family protein n=1 Tax=Aphanothece hegewaldii CCALA 016 TaxID=2107694 RepID=A0A2T1LVC8_9CHRO|nr:PD-(D/E)XK nuclease family protein [Aphanothece hegewaldii]PSF35672.1 PD-(D/E)XK nuclease family protein [Aphanothece hegewaldii CCALA 016]